MEKDVVETETALRSHSQKDIPIPLMLNYLSINDLKQFRTLSKHCNHLIHNCTKFLHKVSIHINGFQIPFSTREILDETIQHLATTSQGWTRFKFSNLNLEGVFLGQEKYFDPFVTNHCSNLKSLHLVNCDVKLGRMMELLAFCNVLVELKICNCSKLYENGMEIVNWAAFVPHFKKTLSRIRCFSLEDPGVASLQAHNLYSWLRPMMRIVKLELKSTNLKSTLPIDFISQYLIGVKKTLRHLSLIGSRSCELSTTSCANLQNLNLKTLSLADFRLLDAMAFSSFIKNQKRLRRLELQCMTLKPPCFYEISTLKLLKHVILIDCRVDEKSCICLNALARATSVQRFDISLTISNTDNDDIHLKQLFEFNAPRPNLIELNIKMKYAGALLSGISENCKNLQSLNLTGAGKPFGEMIPLKYIFEMSTLKRLTLERCELQCMNFMDKLAGLAGRKLGDLQNLEYLNLSFNRLKDCIILEHVVQLANLRELDISGTLITNLGLEELKTKRNKNHCLQKLQKIKATECMGIKLNISMYSNLCYAYKPIILDMDIRTSLFKF